MPYLGIYRVESQKTVVIFEISNPNLSDGNILQKNKNAKIWVSFWARILKSNCHI